MAEIDRNSRVLLGTVRSIVLKVINLSTSMIALADLGAPFVCTLFSMVKLKLLELLVELSGMEDRLNRDSGENGDGGDGGGGNGGDGSGDGGLGGGRGGRREIFGRNRGRVNGGDNLGEYSGAGPVSVNTGAIQVVLNGHSSLTDRQVEDDIATSITLTNMREKTEVVEDVLTSPP